MPPVNLFPVSIQMKNNVPVVSSRDVAKSFDKRHDNVLQSIKTIYRGLLKNKESVNWFFESSYKNEQNKPQPEYLMTRDGFSLLAMGFTGKKALLFKNNGFHIAPLLRF